MDERGLIPGKSETFFFTLNSLDWLCGPLSFLSMVIMGSFPGVKAANKWSFPLASV
jgi:hypothetical protein